MREKISMTRELREIYSHFRTAAVPLEIERYGTGHIHDTYRVVTAPGSHDYILQKLNQNVFRNIPALQQNIERVTTHLRAKFESSGCDADRRTLTLIPTTGGKSWHTTPDGECWRMYIFISDHRSWETVISPEQAVEGGRAIGRFQCMLADLPEPPLNDTIPFFHNIEKRLEAFHIALKADRHNRAGSVKWESEFVTSRQEKMKSLLRLGRQGIIPLRITHNDTKFNNILFDTNGRELCVIDLDTVMPGYIHYDFGDAIRTAASSCAEDETDPEKIYLNINLFRAFAKGYMEEMNPTLRCAEKEQLAFAPALITYTIGLRFLTDYLDGDNYFKIHRPGHNLDRARVQFRLVESNEAQQTLMQQIIRELSV
ncbi:MAG: aminoglycoside phosphotransferase family protein [Bacteroidales bacterium]|nr:aminoglycoside phosphotransferase family protein [Bacteroidales bacterium]